MTMLKIEFKNYLEYDNKLNNMFGVIKNGVKEISEEIYYTGFSNIFKTELEYIIYKELNKITNNQDNSFCKNTTYNIIFNIECSINSLIYIDKLKLFSIKEIEEFIYKSIVWQLGDGTNNEAILDDIVIFK